MEETPSEGFFACYLLCSLNPRYKGRTYIGFTVNPKRRIRQHNGQITCGAWRTKRKRPWDMILCIYGFPTQVIALQFEWAWQHPLRSLAVREAASSIKSLGGIGGKIRLVYTMLTLPEWRSYNLTVNFFSTKHLRDAKGAPPLPDHMRILVAPFDELPCYMDHSRIEEEEEEEEEEHGYSSGDMADDVTNEGCQKAIKVCQGKRQRPEGGVKQVDECEGREEPEFKKDENEEGNSSKDRFGHEVEMQSMQDYMTGGVLDLEQNSHYGNSGFRLSSKEPVKLDCTLFTSYECPVPNDECQIQGRDDKIKETMSEISHSCEDGDDDEKRRETSVSVKTRTRREKLIPVVDITETPPHSPSAIDSPVVVSRILFPSLGDSCHSPLSFTPKNSGTNTACLPDTPGSVVYLGFRSSQHEVVDLTDSPFE